MGNSPLINYVKISPNKTVPRKHTIDTITIHCVVGQCSVETLGNIFANPSKKASSNYGIGPDGRIGLYVEEKDRSWCSSNAANDNRAITIECASDTSHPYAINDKVYNALIELCADICKRNRIKALKWEADKSLIGRVDRQNLTVHKWFSNTSCPGQYIYSRLGQIAADVNSKLGEAVADDTKGVSDVYIPTLRKGSKVKAVRALQTLLIGYGYRMESNGKTYGVDGSFGDATANAVKAYQNANGLDVDGVVGPATWGKLLGSD